MASVCFYFQVHQPWRLRRYSIFDSDTNYFDNYRNGELCRKAAHRSYLPANRMMLDLIQRHEGSFRIAYSISGLALEQLEHYTPEVIESFQRLNETGCVEFLGETYAHSLSFLYSREEFADQVKLQQSRMRQLFGQAPTVFRNTELIFNNDLAHYVEQMGFGGALCEGVDQILDCRSPNYVYDAPGTRRLALLLRNYRLAEDISLRLSDRNWPEWPLTPEKLARWIDQVNGNGYVVNLFMNYEMFSESRLVDAGLFELFRGLPDEVLKHPDNDFKTPSEVIQAFPTSGDYDVPHMISWVSPERDLTAWLGNAMQSNALHELYRMEPDVKTTGSPELLRDWRRLQASDHFYCMSTRSFSDGKANEVSNAYESPYDSYINFMNVLDNLRLRVQAKHKAVSLQAVFT